MKFQKTILGIIAVGLSLSTAACDFSHSTRKTTDGKTVGVEDPGVDPSVKKEENKDVHKKEDPTPPTEVMCKVDADCDANEICNASGACETDKTPTDNTLTLDNIAGKWRATNLVITDVGNGSKIDYLKAGVKMEVIIEKDSTLTTIVVGPKGKVDQQKNIPFTIEDAKYVLYSKDKAEVTLDGNVMHWTISKPDLTEITLERTDSDILITLDDIVGHWNAKSFVLTDPNTGKSEDRIQQGYQFSVNFNENSTVSTWLKDPQSQVSTTDNDPLSLETKDYQILKVKNVPYKTTLDDNNVLHLSGHWIILWVPIPVEITLERANP